MSSRPKTKVNGSAPARAHHTRFLENLTQGVAVHPHRFQSYTFDTSHLKCCSEIRDGCVRAWHLAAEVYLNKITETGFGATTLGPSVSEFGAVHLPPTPESDGVTRDPHFTDLSEVIALELLTETEKDLIIPAARVYHKESDRAQHRGIDLLGYSGEGTGDYALFVIEVMASDENSHPPETVRAHRTQLLDETLNEESLERLRRDLGYAHSESEDKHKPILNGFIATLVRDRRQLAGGVTATAVLVRPSGLLSTLDWKPFQDAARQFETAVLPSRILFKGVDCGLGFVELFKTVRESITGGAAEPSGTQR